MKPTWAAFVLAIVAGLFGTSLRPDGLVGSALQRRVSAAEESTRAHVLGVSGARLTVDGAPRFLVFLSYFDGLDAVRHGHADEDLRYLRDHIDGIRVLPNWWASTCPLRSAPDTLIDLDGAIRASAWADLQRLLDEASMQGLLVDLSFTRETVTDNASPPRVLSQDAYERALATLVGNPRYLKARYPNVLIDVQNEWTRFAPASRIDALLSRLHMADPPRVLAASVSGDAYVPTGRAIPTMVAAYHEPRGKDWFSDRAVAGSVRTVRAVVQQPVYLQEPMPASAVCAGQIVDTDATHFARARSAAKSAGAAAWTFHTRTAFDLSGGSLVEKLRAPAAGAERRAIEALKRQ